MGQGDVLEYLKAHGPATSNQIVDALDCSKHAATRALTTLVKDGYVLKEGDKDDPPMYSYHNRAAAQEEPKKGRGGRKPAITLSKEELEAAFADAGSAKALAERLGCSTQTAITYLDRYGIERRTYGKKRVERIPNEERPPCALQEDAPGTAPDAPGTTQGDEGDEVPEESAAEPVSSLRARVTKLEHDIIEEQEKLKGGDIRYLIVDDAPTIVTGQPVAPDADTAQLNRVPLEDIPAPSGKAVMRSGAAVVCSKGAVYLRLDRGDVERALGAGKGQEGSLEMPERLAQLAVPSYDDLVHLSYGLMLSVHEIGRQYGVLGSTVRRWMLYRGLPMWTDEEEGERQKLKKRMGKKTSPETQAKALRDYQEFWNRQRAEYGYEAEAAV